MVDKKSFISYIDDDGEIKNQYVVIIEESPAGVRFKFNSEETQTIFIPWHKINKLKEEKDE